MPKIPSTPNRTPIEVISHNLPHVTKMMMKNALKDELLPEDQVNKEIQSLVMGHNHIVNAEIRANVAMREATRRGDTKQAARLLGIIDRIKELKQGWPMEVVGK